MLIALLFVASPLTDCIKTEMDSLQIDGATAYKVCNDKDTRKEVQDANKKYNDNWDNVVSACMNNWISHGTTSLAAYKICEVNHSEETTPCNGSVRECNPWTISLGEELSDIVPLTRLELSGNVSDSVYLSFATELGPEFDNDGGWLTYQSVGVYGHVVKSHNSGHSMLVGSQFKLGIGQYQGNSAVFVELELNVGWEYRSQSGFLIRAFVGNAPGWEAQGFFWFLPTTRIQLGYAF